MPVNLRELKKEKKTFFLYLIKIFIILNEKPIRTIRVPSNRGKRTSPRF